MVAVTFMLGPVPRSNRSCVPASPDTCALFLHQPWGQAPRDTSVWQSPPHSWGGHCQVADASHSWLSQREGCADCIPQKSSLLPVGFPFEGVGFLPAPLPLRSERSSYTYVAVTWWGPPRSVPRPPQILAVPRATPITLGFLQSPPPPAAGPVCWKRDP